MKHLNYELFYTHSLRITTSRWLCYCFYNLLMSTILRLFADDTYSKLYSWHVTIFCEVNTTVISIIITNIYFEWILSCVMNIIIELLRNWEYFGFLQLILGYKLLQLKLCGIVLIKTRWSLYCERYCTVK